MSKMGKSFSPRMIDVYIIMLIRSVNYLYDLTEIYTQSVILLNFQNEFVKIS